MINSNGKGKRGEREACQVLNALFGINAHRGQQRKGGAESPDILHDLTGVHFEVKRDENLSIYKAVAQAIRDSEGAAIPVVMHRKNDTPWLLTCQSHQLTALIIALSSKLSSPTPQFVEFKRESRRFNLTLEVLNLKKEYGAFFVVLIHRHPDKDWLSTFVLKDLVAKKGA